MKEARKYLLLAFSLLVANAFSAPSLQPSGLSIAPQTSTKTTSVNSLIQSDVSFLPVEEAFKVTVFTEQSKLILDWIIADNYYLYRDRFKVETTSPAVNLNTIKFETGVSKWDEFFEADLEVYYRRTRLSVPYDYDSDQQSFTIRLEYQGCADAGLCYPPHSRWFEIDPTSGLVQTVSAPSIPAVSSQNRSASSTPLWLVLLLALGGGLILNLMPCVFPVLSIKVLSFTQTHQTNFEKQLHGIAYTLGIVVSFLVIAALMLSLRSAGEAIGWGFQLQSPSFVIFLVYLFALMGLSLSGYLPIGMGLMSLGQSSATDNRLSSSFMTGVLATTVASPCTAPFMGPALGFAIVQPTAVALLVFAALGLGMALPFLLLTMVPKLTNKLPKPGLWMENLKQFLAFPLYMTAIWLLWVVGRQTTVDIVTAVIVGLLLIALAIWLIRLESNRKLLLKVLATGFVLGAFILPAWTLKEIDQEELWEPYSAQRLASLRSQNTPVFVNLTADWCITCLVNERIAFGQSFYEDLDKNGIVYLKGDWTNNDPQITALLNQFNRSGVPLYLMYPNRKGSPEILPQILTESTLIDAIERAK